MQTAFISDDLTAGEPAPVGLSYKDVADRWRCSVRHVRRLCERGSLEVFYAGDLPRVTHDSVCRVESNRSAPRRKSDRAAA